MRWSFFKVRLQFIAAEQKKHFSISRKGEILQQHTISAFRLSDWIVRVRNQLIQFLAYKTTQHKHRQNMRNHQKTKTPLRSFKCSREFCCVRGESGGSVTLCFFGGWNDLDFRHFKILIFNFFRKFSKLITNNHWNCFFFQTNFFQICAIKQNFLVKSMNFESLCPE